MTRERVIDGSWHWGNGNSDPVVSICREGIRIARLPHRSHWLGLDT